MKKQELDFSQLFGLGKANSYTPAKEEERVIQPSPSPDAIGNLAEIKLKRASDYNAAAFRVYQTYNKNRLIAGQKVAEITKGVAQGTPLLKLFLQSVEAIGLLTDDSTLQDSIKNDYLAIRGQGLQEPEALDLDLEGTKTRLDKLRVSAQNPELAADEKIRIDKAIRAQENRISYLTGILNRDKTDSIFK